MHQCNLIGLLFINDKDAPFDQLHLSPLLPKSAHKSLKITPHDNNSGAKISVEYFL